MVWLPARPSPIAAPIAPPPMAMPPPTRAPAMPIAPSIVCPAIFYSSWLVLLRSLEYCGLLLFLLVLVLVFVLLLVARRHVEVDDCEQHEDVGLDRSDSEVEGLPDDFKRTDRLGHQGRHDDDHQTAGEEVAEETERQGNGLGGLFDEVHRRQGREGLGEVLEVTPEAAVAPRFAVHH